SSEILIPKVLSKVLSTFAFFATSTFRWIYAPLPDFFPEGSMLTSPSLFLTTRTNSFLGTISPVTMSFLIGILRCAIIIPPQSYWKKSLTSIDLHHQYHYYQLPRYLNQQHRFLI